MKFSFQKIDPYRAFESQGFDRENITPTDAVKVGWVASAASDKILNILLGLVSGIICDGEINASEIEYFERWRREHSNESLIDELKPVFQIIDDALEDGVLTLDESLKIIDAVCSRRHRHTNFRYETVAVQMLLGLASGAIADGEINRRELEAFSDWIAASRRSFFSSDDSPFSDSFDVTFREIEGAVARAARNFNPESERRLFEKLQELVDPRSGFPTTCEPIEFQNKNFVLSGRFVMGKKKDVAQKIVERGGNVGDRVTLNMDYLIVGGTKSVLWKFDSYGTKVVSAREMIKQGLCVKILGESELLAAFDGESGAGVGI